MSDKEWYLKRQKAPTMYMWILGEMSKGAGIAAIIFFGAVFFVLVLVGLSRLLPEDPYAALELAPRLGDALRMALI